MITDTYIANDVVYRVLENGQAPADFVLNPMLTRMFSKTEIVDAMNRVQQQFLLMTGAIVTRTTITGETGKNQYDLPADSIRPRRLTWADASDTYTTLAIPNLLLESGDDLILENDEGLGLEQDDTITHRRIKALTQTDTWDLDNGANNWPSDRDIPIAWHETTQPQQMVGVGKMPLNDGTIGLLYVALAATLTGLGVNLTIPDDWTPYITWGVLSELLSSDGESFDPVRAKYCDRRFQEGVELANVVLGGS